MNYNTRPSDDNNPHKYVSHEEVQDSQKRNDMYHDPGMKILFELSSCDTF